MEKLMIREPRRFGIRQTIAGLGMGTLAVLAGCSWNDLNPAPSLTHEAEPGAGATEEILANFPGATHIEVTHADDNPNYLSWELEDGRVCTAFASQTLNKGQTPGQLISQPYCRES